MPPPQHRRPPPGVVPPAHDHHHSRYGSNNGLNSSQQDLSCSPYCGRYMAPPSPHSHGYCGCESQTRPYPHAHHSTSSLWNQVGESSCWMSCRLWIITVVKKFINRIETHPVWEESWLSETQTNSNWNIKWQSNWILLEFYRFRCCSFINQTLSALMLK